MFLKQMCLMFRNSCHRLSSNVHYRKLQLTRKMDHEQFDKNKRLFVGDNQTKMYAQFRPTYSDEVYKAIVGFCNENSMTKSSNELAVDIGCGPGLSTLPLTKYFKKVIGVDVSDKQISRAPQDIPNLSFRVCAAEDLPFLQDNSVDLVTTAQTLHWLELDKFFNEVTRVLKPGGSLVVYGYGLMEVDHLKVHEYLMDVYNNVIGSYWSPGRRHIENKYQSFSLPFEGWQRKDDLIMEKCWSVDELMGYLSSWSAVHSYNINHPGQDIIGDIGNEVKKICSLDGVADENRTFKVTWPIFLLMGSKPNTKT